jgi:serine/threonine protein kinase
VSRESELTDSDREWLSTVADEFHAALTRGPVTDWQPFLLKLTDRVRPHGLIEFALIELGHRWKLGERPTVEEYVGRFPDLGPRDAVPGKLIAEEYWCRLVAGEPRDVTQYQQRFPVQFAALKSKLLAMEADQPKPKPKSPPPPPPVAEAIPTAAFSSAPSIGPGDVAGPPPDSSAARSKASEYKFIRRLGSGAFGEVWLAETVKTQIKKAIKILHQAADEDVARKELRSLDIIKNLRHPYLLNTEDYWVADNRLYVVMELADDTLKGRMKECQAEGLPGIPEDELFATMCEAAEGLDFLHEHNVDHRDVKPDNILLLRGHAKVGDFGLARQQEALMAQMSVFAGSPAYMAPEVWGGESGRASDQYSFAVAYVELRQGRLPVHLGPVTEIMFAHLEGRFEFDSLMGEAEQAAVLRALSKEPGERYGSCLEFMEGLAQALGRRYVRPSAKKKSGSTSQPQLRPLPPPTGRSGTVTMPNARGTTTAKTASSQAGRGTLGAASTVAGDARRGPPRPPGPAAAATQLYTPGGTTTRRPVRPPARRWAAIAVAAGIILAIVGLIAFVLWGNRDTGKTPSSSTPPSGDTTPTSSPTPPTKHDPPPPPPPDEPWKPDGTVGDKDGEVRRIVGRRVYEWVTATVNGQPVRFRLIPADTPFYISAEKITNRAFGSAGVPNVPATGMTVAEAGTFAREKLGGRLPTPAEWDLAAGLPKATDPKAGVNLPGGVPWVNKDAPAPAKREQADLNEYGLYDMAGNGREWTCGVLNPGGPPPVIDARTDGSFAKTDLIVLRGRNYTLARGLTFEELKKEADRQPQTQLAEVKSPYTGFRVVLPVK